jgi:hypothetical protein
VAGAGRGGGILLGALVLAMVGAMPRSLAAQGGGVVQTTIPGRPVMTPRERALYDSAQRAKAKRDSAERDSSQKKLVNWVAPDSETDALLQREGYGVTRYQGGAANYNADSHALTLTGVPGEDRAAVNQQQTIVVGDTIVYHDSTRIVNAHGDTITVRDPARNQDDIVTIRSLTYDVPSHTALTSNVRTVFPSGGNRWIIGADAGAFQGDTISRHDTTSQRDTTPANTFYGLEGAVTTCDDSFPHYHFSVKELKFVTKHVLVGRPAVLYIADVPVMWLPFIVQDLRTGRRSGVLTPQFGISELLRNSPSYRRHVENVGYYFDINDYMDLQTWLDWRSSARASEEDPGWTRYSEVFRYHWLDRFVTGSFGVSYETLSNGTTNTAISWQHQQDFSLTSHLNMNINYETSTAIQQTTYFNPYTVLAVISSQLNYQQALGPANISIGGTQKQYPGRSEVDRVFPTVSLSSRPVTIGNWFSWTPSLSATNTESLKIDEFGNFSELYAPGPLNTVDSTPVTRDQRATTGTFDTPLKIFGFTWRNSFRLSDQQNNFPEQDIVYVPTVINGRDTAIATERTFSQTFNTSLDWDTGIDLPSLLQGSWNVVPSVSIQNADPGASFMIRTQFTGADFVTQPKRPLFGLSLSPTFYGLFPGIGDVSRFRHSITPVITFNYAPAASISDQFFAAAGQSPIGSLAGLQQKSISLSLSQNIEAKLRTKPDEDPERAKKIKVLSLNFDPITYDFERASYTQTTLAAQHTQSSWLSGFTNGSWGYSFRSDLLPGFDFRQTYSLFQGDPLSDTAVFKPYWDQISAAWSLKGSSGIIAAVSRLLGLRPPVTQPVSDTGLAARDPFLAQQIAAGNVITGATGVVPYTSIPTGQGWQATFTFSAYRQRPPVGNLSNVIQYNPATVCAPYQTVNPVYYNQCLQAKRYSTPDTNFNATTAAAPFVLVPATTTLQASTSFNITPKWAAQWQTTYDFRVHNFASQIVSLQRDLHDWRAIFSFTQSPTGSFAFSFFVALKAEPALKFNYDKETYLSPGTESTGQTY